MRSPATVPQWRGERFIELVASEVVVFDLNKFITVILFLSVIDPASAGPKQREEMPREGFSYPAP